MLLATKHINRVFVNYYYDQVIIFIPLFVIKEDSGMFRSYSWFCKCHLSIQNSFSSTKKRGRVGLGRSLVWWFYFKAVLSNGSLWDDENVLYLLSSVSHMWLLSSWNVDSVTEELNLKFYLILNNLNLNSHMRLVVIVLDNTVRQWER